MSSSSSTSSRKTEERAKLIQEKCQTLLTQMLRDEDNKYCVDCDAKGPRWASWNLGVFLCIRCAGIHRNLGVHISRVKSVNLDSWTPEQVVSLQQMGNSRARAVYEAQLPDGFRRPQTDTALETFIRAKYEHKKYLAREWVQPPPPKVDWAKEIDEELERQKRKKKAAQAGNSIGMGVLTGSSTGGGDKKATPSSGGKSAALPAPLPKPKPNQSPKAQRQTTSGSGEQNSNQTNDLLGLSSPTKPTVDTHNDTFSNFLSATATSNTTNASGQENNKQNTKTTATSEASSSSTANSLAKEEEDFFNQGSLGGAATDKDKSGKLTKDGILALYGQGVNPVAAPNPQFNPGMFGGASTGSFTGMSPGSYLQSGPQAPHGHTQFMTPPNSTSMYNSPVMTAPTAFSSPGMPGMGGFPTAGYPPQMASLGNMMGGAGNPGIMATGQSLNYPQQHQQQPQQQQTNLNLLSGLSMPTMMVGAGGLPTMSTGPMSMPVGMGMGGGVGGMVGGMPAAMGGGMFPSSGTNANASSSSTGNLNQQFGNLNIGNVWQ